MIIKTYKERIGWGKWATIDIYRCTCGHENKAIRNWKGTKPPGAFLCSNCNNQIRI